MFFFVTILFTIFPTIDQVTAIVPGGVHWCFLLSCIGVVLIMNMIMIIIIFLIMIVRISFEIIFVLALLSFFISVAEFILDSILYILLLLLFTNISGRDFCLFVWMLSVH